MWNPFTVRHNSSPFVDWYLSPFFNDFSSLLQRVFLPSVDRCFSLLQGVFLPSVDRCLSSAGDVSLHCKQIFIPSSRSASLCCRQIFLPTSRSVCPICRQVSKLAWSHNILYAVLLQNMLCPALVLFCDQISWCLLCIVFDGNQISCLLCIVFECAFKCPDFGLCKTIDYVYQHFVWTSITF